MSYEGDGMKLHDLAGGSRNSTSCLPAFHVFQSRFWNRKTARRSRESYESVPRLPPLRAFSHFYSKRPWTLFLGFFVVLAILGPLLPFLFGRIVEIKPFVSVRTTGCLLTFPNFGTEPTQGIPRSFDRWRLIQGGR